MPRSSAIEREVVHAFQDAGWFCRRATSSGGGMTQASYDVVAAMDGQVVVAEVKYRDPESQPYAYLDKQEVIDLQWVARQFGAVPLLVVRWKGDTSLYAYRPGMATRTDGGSYRISNAMRSNALSIPPESEGLSMPDT